MKKKRGVYLIQDFFKEYEALWTLRQTLNSPFYLSVTFLWNLLQHTLGFFQATARCMDCAISFCEHCEEVHSAQKMSLNHEVLTLDQAREKGITKVRRQVMCMKHSELELTIFCCTCSQVSESKNGNLFIILKEL